MDFEREKSFLPKSLGNVDFVEKKSTHGPNPNPSASFDTLLGQNEDLSSRLKVTLKRLSLLEKDLEQAKQFSLQTQNKSVSLQDQLEVWKEKEKIWNIKRQQIEQRLWAIDSLEPSVKDLQTAYKRHQKYHQKIKTVIKPYIENLKSFANQMGSRIKSLQRDLDVKKNQIQQLQLEIEIQKENHLVELKTESSQVHFLNQKLNRQHWDQQKNMALLKEENKDLQAKAEKLFESLQRQDELDNELQSFKTLYQEQSQKLDQQQNSHREQMKEMATKLHDKSLRLDETVKKNQDLQERNSKLDRSLQTVEEQLASLRFLWASKSDELERYKISIRSLEKLNGELSQKINQLRGSAAASKNS